MASNKKKINIPISSLSSEEVYALLDDIDNDYEEEIDNLMTNLWTGQLLRIQKVIFQKQYVKKILTTKPIEAVV